MDATTAASGLGASRIWPVGALCKAVADSLDARFNPVSVAGEISGFTRASSGHCYFVLKDGSGQLRCALFKRAAAMLDFVPRDGELVEVRARLGVYEPRGELQLIVESVRRAGQGRLFEQFLQLKARLEAQGLFDAERKRSLPRMPRGIGLVTSLGAAALHDVVTALQRRVPHIPVFLAPAAVQGEGAPTELVRALQALNALAQTGASLDVILLVRGGGSLEDLWSFNDEALVHAIVESALPVVCGVGHETDFTLADFAADLRAPTPTAAAELAAPARSQLLDALEQQESRLATAVQRRLERQAQTLDRCSATLGRLGHAFARHGTQLSALAQRLDHLLATNLIAKGQGHALACARLEQALQRGLQLRHEALERRSMQLQMLDPGQILRRGYARLSDATGQVLYSVQQLPPGQAVRATLAEGTVDLTVR